MPTIQVEHLSEAEARAFAIADNKLSENAKWDKKLLSEIYLELGSMELDFSLDITGFEMNQINILMENLPDLEAAPEEILPAVPENAVSKVGDLWILGNHRILCGDALAPASFHALMQQQSAHMVFIDPPYNVPIDGHVSGLGKKVHAEFAQASGEMTPDQFIDFLSNAMARLCENSIDGSLHYICMDWRHDLELRTAALGQYQEHKNTCVWVKDNGGMGSLYRSQHEFIFVFKHGTATHTNNIQLGEFGRYRTNVWSYAGYNSFAREGDGEGNLLTAHPTVKPVALVADAIKDATHQGEIVLDSFLGSGSTLIACEKTNRRCYGMELEPRYIDVAIRRWQALTGKDAIHPETGKSFNQIAQDRGVVHV